jgi:hypothetical protein
MNQPRMPSPAILVAMLALVAALAGTALAGPDATPSALTKSKVKKIAKKQINKLVPGIADAQITARAPGLSVARADTAGNAEALEGQPASAFASSDSEPYHEVGAPGEPAFQNGWVNAGTSFSTAAFYKDPLGVVHLKGTIFRNPGGPVAFTLPPGYRPSKILGMPMADTDGSGSGDLIIQSDGDVLPGCDDAGGCEAGIDGLTFRAEG